MLLPVALALLGVKVPMVIAQGFAMPRNVDASQLPVDFEKFTLVDAAMRQQPDLSNPDVVDKLEQQWLEAAQRIPTEAINRCPVSCSSAGSDSLKWDVYPDVTRMAKCEKTMLFDMAVFSTPVGLRVCTADLATGTEASKRSLDSANTCAPAFEVETSTSLRLASTGKQQEPAKAAAGVASAIRQISSHFSNVVPSCNNNTVAFAHSGNAVVGLYVGAQAHRQGRIAADILDRVLAWVESEAVLEDFVAELCESEFSSDYVVGVVISTANNLSKLQERVRTWSKGSCLAAPASSQTLGETITLLIPAPGSSLSTNTPSSNNTSFSNSTGQSPAYRVRDTGSMFRGLAARQQYCSNVKSVVSGNTCDIIADKRCTISTSTFLSYNPGIDCNNLWVGQKVCCTPGAVPPPDPIVPAPDSYCTNWKTVQAGHTCEHMADKRCIVSLSTFKARNPQLDCNKLRVGQTFCCNAGRVPPENECSNSKTVLAGNSCLQMADKRCTVSIEKFVEYNPHLDCIGKTLKIGEPFCCNHGRVPPPGPPPNADGTCQTAVVADKDGCFCANLAEGQTFCCGRGTLPDLRPKKNADGSCFDYTVQSLDNCNKIAVRHQLTQADLFRFNKNTYGWNGCDNLQLNLKICLSEGTPPMPTVDATAVCGPTVLGTKRPANGTALADLNPCPLNVCCNHWGQCGMTHEFCSITNSTTGNPGTTTCVSNCGNDIIMSSAPAGQMRIAYFEAWNGNRPCLRMNVDQIDTYKYTHIHFAFAEVSPSFEVVISHVQDEWDRFIAMKGNVKKIISFGGWDFSVLEGTYRILRDAVKPANRETFRKNVVDFVNRYNLDGVDLDWEYPGSPDSMPTPGDPVEGLNYATWLRRVRETLPRSKTVSFAAPASYWYLKTFPISAMASYVDYVVYMTYDLHGQWDVGNKYAIDGCEAGNCLRSHVNITETMGALSMITKAGMPSNKVVVGVTSYGRSFRMAQKDCVDPMCTFTGTRNDSHAAPGRCTGTKGYISNAEINDIIRYNPTAIHYQLDMTNYLVYNDYEWVAYMSDENKALREALYESLHMRGSTDWAVDLQSFDSESFYGADPLDELDPEYEVARCTPRIFYTLDEIKNAKVNPRCMDSYVLEVLALLLEKAVAKYDAIMRTDYDKKFGSFAKAVKESWAAKMRSFYWKDGDTDDWYNCYKVGGNAKVDCPPGKEQTTSVRMEVKDEKAFGEHIKKEYGIDYEDTMAGNVRLNLAEDICVGTPGNNWGQQCSHPNTEGTEAIGVRLLRDDLEIPNPKEGIEESLNNLRKLPSYLRTVASLDQLNVLGPDMLASDVVETSATAIFLVQESVHAMKKAYEIGANLEEEEKKKKREDIIKWVLSAILLILPGAGQALAAFTRIAMIGRLAKQASTLGSIGMAANDIVENPGNTVLSLFFLVIDLIPGIGTFTKGKWVEGALMARGIMTNQDVNQLGVFVKDSFTDLMDVRSKGVCF